MSRIYSPTKFGVQKSDLIEIQGQVSHEMYGDFQEITVLRLKMSPYQ